MSQYTQNSGNLSLISEKLTELLYNPGFSCWVNITHINNPQSFYVRPTFLEPYLNEVEAVGEMFDTSEIGQGVKVTFQSTYLNKFVRGLVIRTETCNGITKYSIFAVDYGFVDTCADANIRKPVVLLPPLAQHCELADCKPLGNKSWSDEAIKAMKVYVGNERAMLRVRSKRGDIISVELINSCPDDISTLMILTGYSTWGYHKNMVNRFEDVKIYEILPKYIFRQVVLGEKLAMRILSKKANTSDELYVAETSEYKQYEALRRDFNYYCKKLPHMEPTEIIVGKPVGVVNINYTYERGIIKEVLPKEKAIVRLVDIGTDMEVHVSKLKLMKAKFLHYPAIAMYCKIHAPQFQKFDDFLCKHFGREFLIQIRKVGDGVNMPHEIVYIESIVTKRT